MDKDLLLFRLFLSRSGFLFPFFLHHYFIGSHKPCLNFYIELTTFERCSGEAYARNLCCSLMHTSLETLPHAGST